MGKKKDIVKEIVSGESGTQMEEKTLEDGFAKLEALIKEMEDPEISLEECFALYHNGVGTLRFCNEKIDRIEKKVLILDEQGEKDEFGE